MTIARGLDAERMKKAQNQFIDTEINLEFNCDCIDVRRLMRIHNSILRSLKK